MKQYANELLAAWDAGICIPLISAREKTFSWNDAYDVSAEIIRLRRARGEKTVGRKIGFTNRNIWPQYGATSPIWHPVYDRTLIRAQNGRATLSLAGSCQPLIEPEIAFGLGGPVPVNCSHPATVLRSIAWYAPSFEIVCCHFAD
jgi:2-keto-4-pentenoate hydratase